MNILVFAKAYPPETGGVETYSEKVAIAYASAGHSVTVVTAHPGPIGQETRNQVKVVNVGQSGGQVLVFVRMMFCLFRIRTLPFDFVHATTWRVALPALVIRRPLPLVVSVHGREVFVVPVLLRPVMRWVLRRSQYISVVSKPILEMLERHLNIELQHAFSNWNGISFEQESLGPSSREDPVKLFCMCRLVERKNLDTAIRAVAALLDGGAQIEFHLAGNGPDMNKLKALVQELGVADRVHLLGHVSDKVAVRLYRESHIFLHPQIATAAGGDLEGFGLTIADAMSFGCVPIAGASGGPLDFLEDGRTGFLIDGRDQTSIEEAVKKLVNSPERIEDMGQAAQHFAREKLTWDAHAYAILKRFGR